MKMVFFNLPFLIFWTLEWLKLKKYLHINNKYINFELMELKEYIKTNFGTYQNLADVLQLHKGTVANAISKDTDVSWLNLLKYLSQKNGKTS